MSELARRDDPDLNRLARLGEWLALAESGSTDKVARGAAAALRLYYAEQLGLPPLAALELSVIKGRLVPSSQLLRAMADRAGVRVVRLDESDTSCTAGVLDLASGELIGQTTFTIEDARKAKLVKDDSGWVKYPKRMLWARASGYAVRDYAPRVALGMIFEDEVEEVAGQPAPSFDWDAEPDEEIEWPDSTEDAPETPPEAAGEPAEAESPPVVDRKSTPRTKEQNDKIHAQIRELEFMEQQAGLDPTNWRAFYRGAAGAEIDATLTRAQASLAIEALDRERMRLYELVRP